jgi:3-phytase
MPTRASIALLVCAALAACDDDPTRPDVPDATPTAPTMQVLAAGETEAKDGDPDDPSIWVDPTDPARSLLIVTDKKHGLRVHDLDGRVLHEHADGDMNNVDLRGDVVAASNRSDDSIVVYRVDAAAHDLIRLGAVPTGVIVYGLCLHEHAGGLDAIVTTKDGEVVQLALTLTDTSVTAVEARRVQLGSQLEGCVADDALGRLYVGEEDVGVWTLPAEASAPAAPVMLDAVGAGHLVADVEGMTIFQEDAATGYLLVSSQGDSAYAVYRREPPNAYVGRFRITAGPLDAASETDGIDVTSASLGPAFPDGLFVVQDDKNEGFSKNFKLVRWGDIASAFTPPL